MVKIVDKEGTRIVERSRVDRIPPGRFTADNPDGGVIRDGVEPGTFRVVPDTEQTREESEAYYRGARREYELNKFPGVNPDNIWQYRAFIDSPEYDQLKEQKLGKSLELVYFASGEDMSPYEAFDLATNDRCWYVDIDEEEIGSLKREFENTLQPVPNHRAVRQSAFEFRLPDEKQIDVVILRDASMSISGKAKMLPLTSNLVNGGFVIVSAWGNHDDARTLADEENFRLVGKFVQRRDQEGHLQWQIDRDNMNRVKEELLQNVQKQDQQGDILDKYAGTTFIFQKLPRATTEK